MGCPRESPGRVFLGSLAGMGQISSTHRMLLLETWSLLLLVDLAISGRSFTAFRIILLMPLVIKPWGIDSYEAGMVKIMMTK